MNVGDVHRETRLQKVVKRKFTADFPAAVIQERAELTLLAHEEGVLRSFVEQFKSRRPKKVASAGHSSLSRSLQGSRRISVGSRVLPQQRRAPSGKKQDIWR